MVAVVGRPNVGKSTLVNRFVGRRDAIVEEKPGVTRDRKMLEADWNGRSFIVVDTGGWLAPTSGDGAAPLARQVSRQAERAVADADVILMVVDVNVGITEEDAQVAHILQRTEQAGAPRGQQGRRRAPRERGLVASPASASARRTRCRPSTDGGVATSSTRWSTRCPPSPSAGADDPTTTGSSPSPIVGRPNVGKSTLFNRLVGDERSIVHDMPGTTRDAVDTVVETDDGPLRFVDTAGMRRRSKIDEPTEYFSLVRALQAVDRADAALLVIDAHEGVSHQDQRLAERVDAAGTAIVIVLNKWDLLDAEGRAKAKIDVADRLAFLSYAPVLTVSALTGKMMQKVLPALRQAEEAYHQRVPTAALNRVIREAQASHPPPAAKRHRARILYATQGANDPPTFTLFATHELPPTYLRYVERKIREAFDLGPTPIKLRVRRRNG